MELFGAGAEISGCATHVRTFLGVHCANMDILPAIVDLDSFE